MYNEKKPKKIKDRPWLEAKIKKKSKKKFNSPKNLIQK